MEARGGQGAAAAESAVGARRLVLASASPQRRAILERLGVYFEVRVSGVEESEHGDPGAVALGNARQKARAVARPGETVIGCDTVVVLDDTIYGKPADAGAARETLLALAGRTHQVLSGLVVLHGDSERQTLARTGVTFRELSEPVIDWYVGLGEWRERAGGYAIQGVGGALVRELHGGYENVVGLPLPELIDICPQLLGGS